MTTDPELTALRERLGEVADLHAAIGLLHWDQEVYMPPKAAAARGQQLATLSALGHRLFTSEETGKLLDTLEARLDGLGPVDAKLVEVARYDFDRATRLPEPFVRTFAEACSAAYEAWVRARQASDFPTFAPHLARIVELNRQKAELLGYEGSPYNALLETYERGMTAEQLIPLFAELSARQSALIERIMASPRQPDIAWARQDWDEQRQWDFTVEVLRDMGYDFEAGRQDRSVHPFTAGFDICDVRVTTRFDRRDPFSALSSSMHEGGHALYSQGHDPADRRTPLAEGPSLGIHESQSRLWENLIGRSLPFWRRYTARLQAWFPGQLDGIGPDEVYRAVNRVAPSLIRVEADECTYNLHVILRFEIEIDLIEGRLSIDRVPEAWNAKVKDYLGLDVPNDAQGCLQDIHWSHGSFGYFPTYALGNLYAAQLFEKIQAGLPELDAQVERGEFAPLLAWLREHVHRHGRRKLAGEILRDATGHSLEAEPYLRYLETKYSALYEL